MQRCDWSVASVTLPPWPPPPTLHSSPISSSSAAYFLSISFAVNRKRFSTFCLTSVLLSPPLFLPQLWGDWVSLLVSTLLSLRLLFSFLLVNQLNLSNQKEVCVRVWGRDRWCEEQKWWRRWLWWWWCGDDDDDHPDHIEWREFGVFPRASSNMLVRAFVCAPCSALCCVFAAQTNALSVRTNRFSGGLSK